MVEISPFLPDLLLKELMMAMRHRKDVYTASREVLATIVRRLLRLPGKPVFRAPDITRVTTEVLKRFDRRAYLRYSADHPLTLGGRLTRTRSDLVAFSVTLKPRYYRTPGASGS